MVNNDSEGQGTVREMSFPEFMERICTNPRGRRITTMHVYADGKASREIIDATPKWVEVGKHPSVADY